MSDVKADKLRTMFVVLALVAMYLAHLGLSIKATMSTNWANTTHCGSIGMYKKCCMNPNVTTITQKCKWIHENIDDTAATLLEVALYVTFVPIAIVGFITVGYYLLLKCQGCCIFIDVDKFERFTHRVFIPFGAMVLYPCFLSGILMEICCSLVPGKFTEASSEIKTTFVEALIGAVCGQIPPLCITVYFTVKWTKRTWLERDRKGRHDAAVEKLGEMEQAKPLND